MTNAELNTFRRALKNREAELGSRSRQREALTIETSPDELDRIQHASDHEQAMNNLEREYNRMLEVRMALRRIGDGTFGICVGCEEDISPKRLAAIPWASSCIVCQEAPEKTPWSEIRTAAVLAA
ncbi:MAG: TraR/DksA family transcriptional regulator [Bryobacteraceae bacterium]|jgi:DnaK suppressor protein